MTQDFNWNLPGLNKLEFTAYANLLALRNDGQVESVSLGTELSDKNESTIDSDAISIDTSYRDQISDSGYHQLKTKFLDCLAELIANRKGGKYVACSSMMEDEENVTLWITRNGGFQIVDNIFFEKLSKRLSGLFHGKDLPNRIVEVVLWNEMLAYYEDRLEETYIPNLRLSLKSYNTTFNDYNNDRFATARNELSVLQNQTFARLETGQRLIDRHSTLVTKAYELRKSKVVEELLQTSPKSTKQTRKLWLDICFLGRLRVILERFKEVSLKLPSFNNVTITAVTGDRIPQKALKDALKLKETLKLLDLPTDTLTVKTVIGPSWTVAKAEREYGKLQKQALNIHAEIQMILFLSKNERLLDQSFAYFGCSKYSCFMCSHFLKAYGRIGTRGCHGRLFKPWTVPEAIGLASSQADKVAKSVVQVQKDIEKELKSDFDKAIRLEKTSVVGGSSIFSDHNSEKSGKHLVIERRKKKMEQERVARLFNRPSVERSGTPFPKRTWGNLSDGTLVESEELGECNTCSRVTSRLCSICNIDYYCSESCETRTNGSHVFTCAKRPLTSADYLYINISENTIPDEEEVLEDFGFNHLSSFADRSNLLGLYKGLWLGGVPVEDIHRWQVESTLITNIKKHFYQINEAHRGGYFPWFLVNLHILEKPLTKEESTQNLLATFYDQAQLYLDKEDQHKQPSQLKPEAKMKCYELLATALHMARPNPIQMNWYNFGFCTCNDEREESALGVLYTRLLLGNELLGDLRGNTQHMFYGPAPLTATFTEFWHAYESGTLIELIDSKGLKKMRSEFKLLEWFLSVSPSGPQPSVWSLKQFVAIDNPAEFPPNETVKVDYGFMNCQTFEETCILLETYKRLLREADLLELHEACLAGELFEFAESYHHMDENHRR
ncbi:putative zf-mynd domain-containing protein [Botrytis fragariae]|uniref:Putative zf-mynd domain-containing protein n=1 Tax=Botrytis fragariae TaxID=1964551 RepID=A0A8H6ELK5_9HELO|nr:putative zf-mynd domain-containing protein [Botrytis fragariae]KAF5876693.1 putative zf-mynd domain-containing protein [Botrytis fragariae]